MWSMILLMSRLPGDIPSLRAGDRKSLATNSRQSAGRHTRRLVSTERSDGRLGRSATRVKGSWYPGAV